MCGKHRDQHKGVKHKKSKEVTFGLLCKVPTSDPTAFCDPAVLSSGWLQSQNKLYKSLAKTRAEMKADEQALTLAHQRNHEYNKKKDSCW